MGILNRFKKEDSSNERKPEAQQAPATQAAVKVAPKVEVKTVAPNKVSVAASGVIVKPLVTEKSATLGSANQYVFVVSKNANRIQVRSAIKAMYGIMPSRVNIQNVRGKAVRFGRARGKRKDWKKAIVTLPKGKTINVYEGV
jgi:large subunit ribosomal protein L23